MLPYQMNFIKTKYVDYVSNVVVTIITSNQLLMQETLNFTESKNSHNGTVLTEIAG